MTWQSACAVPATTALLCAHAALVVPPVVTEAAAKAKAKAAAEAAKKSDTTKAKAVAAAAKADAAAGKKSRAAKADAAAAKAQAEAAVAKEDAGNSSPAKSSPAKGGSAKETSPKTTPAKKGSTKVRRPHRQLATLMILDCGHTSSCFACCALVVGQKAAPEKEDWEGTTDMRIPYAVQQTDLVKETFVSQGAGAGLLERWTLILTAGCICLAARLPDRQVGRLGETHGAHPAQGQGPGARLETSCSRDPVTWRCDMTSRDLLGPLSAGHLRPAPGRDDGAGGHGRVERLQGREAAARQPPLRPLRRQYLRVLGGLSSATDSSARRLTLVGTAAVVCVGRGPAVT